MPAIQAMRSDALAMRAKEEIQEKIPSFYNSVSQSLGQGIVAGQDAAEQLLESRMQAANQIIAQLRQKIDGQGALAELTAGAGTKLISSAISVILSVLSKTTVTDLIELGSAIVTFMTERQTLKLQWDAAAATYAQWVVQAGYGGNGNFFNIENYSVGARGALKYRDAFTPRFTDRRYYIDRNLAIRDYDTYYGWGSVGSITRVGESA